MMTVLFALFVVLYGLSSTRGGIAGYPEHGDGEVDAVVGADVDGETRPRLSQPPPPVAPPVERVLLRAPLSAVFTPHDGVIRPEIVVLLQETIRAANRAKSSPGHRLTHIRIAAPNAVVQVAAAGKPEVRSSAPCLECIAEIEGVLVKLCAVPSETIRTEFRFTSKDTSIGMSKSWWYAAIITVAATR